MGKFGLVWALLRWKVDWSFFPSLPLTRDKIVKISQSHFRPLSVPLNTSPIETKTIHFCLGRFDFFVDLVFFGWDKKWIYCPIWVEMLSRYEMKKRVSRPFIVVRNNMLVILAGRSPPRTNLSSTWKFQLFSRSNWGCVDPLKQKTRWSGWVPSVICSNSLGRLVLLFIIPLVFQKDSGFWVGWNFHRISYPTTTEIRRKPGHSRRGRDWTILFDGWSGLSKRVGWPGRVWKIQTSLFFSQSNFAHRNPNYTTKSGVIRWGYPFLSTNPPLFHFQKGWNGVGLVNIGRQRRSPGQVDICVGVVGIKYKTRLFLDRFTPIDRIWNWFSF